MRIAYLCADFGIPVFGTKGASIHLRELCRALRADGHEVLVLSPRIEGTAPTDFDVPVREVGLEASARATCERIRRNLVDGGDAAAREIRALLYGRSLRRQVPAALRDFEPDLVYERYSLFGVAGVALARDLGVPLILEVNAPLAREQAAHRGLRLGATARRLEEYALRSATRVIAVSSKLEHWLIGLGVGPERITVLPNAVDPARFQACGPLSDEIRARLGLGGRRVVGFLGTLKPWHDTEALVRAVATLRRRRHDVHLLIVGDGPQRGALEALVVDEGLDEAATFTGAVAHERVPGYLAAMDVAVVPYPPMEDFYFSPLKLFECMAAGRPVVAADIGEIGHCVRHGETGWLYAPGDVAALADAVFEALADLARSAALGRAGRQHVDEHHTWARNAQAVVDLARPLVVERGLSR